MTGSSSTTVCTVRSGSFDSTVISNIPTKVYRQGQRLNGAAKEFTVFGPTCDSTDRLPEPIALHRDIAVGDHIEFECTGAYSLSGRTNFNGFYSTSIVTIRP